MSEDVKNAIHEMGTTFEEFKKVNDQRLDAIEKGESSAQFDEKLAKIEKSLDALEDVKIKLDQAEQKQESINEVVEKLDTVISRPNSGFSTKQVDEYMTAFDQYCRKGEKSLSADEQKALTVNNDSTGGYLAPPE